MLLYLCKSIIDDESSAFIPPTQKAFSDTEKINKTFLLVAHKPSHIFEDVKEET